MACARPRGNGDVLKLLLRPSDSDLRCDSELTWLGLSNSESESESESFGITYELSPCRTRKFAEAGIRRTFYEFECTSRFKLTARARLTRDPVFNLKFFGPGSGGSATGWKL